jgi:DNA-binding response OmpR family regulator
MRLLVLEDDTRLRAAFAARLRQDGNAVDEAGTLAEAEGWIGRVTFDCLVLDRLVPDGDSVDLVREIDKETERPPVLMISALGAGAERVKGLALGADDYMVKPVHLEELALRVQKLLAPTATSSRELLMLGRVGLDRAHRHVTRDGVRVHLTPTQYTLLEQLAVNAGSLVTKHHLLAHGWDAHEHVRGTSLHSHITRLRRIFAGALTIESTWGEGYTLRISESCSTPAGRQT